MEMKCSLKVTSKDGTSTVKTSKEGMLVVLYQRFENGLPVICIKFSGISGILTPITNFPDFHQNNQITGTSEYYF